MLPLIRLKFEWLSTRSFRQGVTGSTQMITSTYPVITLSVGGNSQTFLIEIKCHTVLECLKITAGAVKALELIPKEARVGSAFS
jgi:hypothetical protein